VTVRAGRGLPQACAFPDALTAAHARRVGELSAHIAAELGLSAAMVEALRVCAPLHDVGKLAIPTGILQKPGALTAQERSVVERHTTIGALMLSGSAWPLARLAAEIALTHHEHWDGSGYPGGRAGTDIPLAGRIVAVADVFDALTHERTYKQAWPLRAAITEMTSQRGRHFDPDVVDALLRVDEVAAAA